MTPLMVQMELAEELFALNKKAEGTMEVYIDLAKAILEAHHGKLVLKRQLALFQSPHF